MNSDIKDGIVRMLLSNNKEDIEFGILLSKEHNLFHEINKFLKKNAVPSKRWRNWESNEDHDTLNNEWCTSANFPHLVFRVCDWKNNRSEIIYFK